MQWRSVPFALALPLSLLACGDDAGGGDLEVPESYAFESRFVDGSEAVSISGQVFRHLLLDGMDGYIGELTDDVDSSPPAAGDVESSLEFYFDFDSSVSGSLPLGLDLSLPTLQTSYDDVSSGKNLIDKVAGNDSTTDHKAWNTAGTMVGWDDGEDLTPTTLIRGWFAELDALAVARGQGSPALDPEGNPVEFVYLNARGHDLRQLTDKFITGAVAFSQGLDDYLSDDVEGKGLLSPNTQDEDKPYSTLGHAWDEAFGYFGASFDYGDYDDDERAGKGGRDDYQKHHDSNGDGSIDLKGEVVRGHAVNCGKRDRDSVVETGFGDAAFDAFKAGRTLIYNAGEELSESELDELRGYRDTININWENCLAATVVHYINNTIANVESFGSDGYDYSAHAKDWSELKGFALVLQFNPDSPLQEGSRFAELHDLIGMQSVLPNDEGGQSAFDAYISDLEEARDLMQEAYGFDAQNVEAW